MSVTVCSIDCIATPDTMILSRMTQPLAHHHRVNRLINHITPILSMSTTSSSPDPSPEVLHQSYENGLGHIHLNRPKALNSLNINMCKIILNNLNEWNANQSIKSILITGEGRAFCAGGDIRSLAFPPHKHWAEEFFRLEYTMNYQLATYNKPIISIMHGVCMGGGVGLSVHGKYRIATDTTNFAMPETGIGLFTDVGATYFLPRLAGGFGQFLGMTGYRCNGIDILYLGIATHYITKQQIDPLIHELQSTQLNHVNKILTKYHTQPSEQSKLITIKHWIDKSFKTWSVQELLNNLESQSNSSDTDEAEWAQSQLKILSGKSRTSMEVTMHGLHAGSQMDLASCLRQEYRMGVRTCRANGDFQEGVRALIVDKDNKPKWNHPPSKHDVQSYFSEFKPEEDIKDLDLPHHKVQGL